MKTKRPRKVRGRQTRLGKSFAHLMSLLMLVLGAVFTWPIVQSREKSLLFALATILAVAGMVGVVWLIRYLVGRMDHFIPSSTIERVESPH